MAEHGHHGFHWWDLLHNEYLSTHPHVAAGTVGVITILATAVAYRMTAPALSAQSTNDQDFVPPAKLGVRNVFELIGEFVQGLAKDIIGHHYAEYLPLLIFVFFWTLTNNLLGLIPGFGATTDNLNTTFAMGFFVFLYYNFVGFKANGFHYLEQYTGHLKGILLLALGPVMFVIELISHCVRPVTLGIRLRSNMLGDHTIYGAFLDIFMQLGNTLSQKLGTVGTILGGIFTALGPVPIVILGLLVCVIQAFVFTLLTTIYVGMATAHEEH